MVMCIIEGCNCDKIVAKNMCYRHYNQMRKYGKISDQINRNENKIVIEGDIAKMDLYNKLGNKISEVIFDSEDVDKVKQYSWHRTDLQRSTYYCKSNKVGRLHRFILDCPEDMIVDHINHNGLDNRKCNLRLCHNQQNICNCNIPKNNTSGHKGIYWNRDKNKWTVQISINNKTKYIGRYDDLEDAIIARKQAAEKYYGEFANEI